MKRLLPFIIVVTTVLAALLVIVIQPQQTAVHKKRLKDMRQFLLAQTPPLYCDSFSNAETYDPHYSACPPPSTLPDSEIISGGGSQGGLTSTQQNACFDEFHASPFWKLIGETSGLPATNPTNMYSTIIQICGYIQNAITGKYGGDAITLNDANKEIERVSNAFLRATPGSDTKTAYEYLKQGRDIMQKFTATTLTNEYIIMPSPYVINLERDLTNLIKKPATPASQENKITITLTPPPPLPIQPQSVPPENSIVRTIHTFIKKIKESLSVLREHGRDRRMFKARVDNKKFRTDYERLILYFRQMNR